MPFKIFSYLKGYLTHENVILIKIHKIYNVKIKGIH